MSKVTQLYLVETAGHSVLKLLLCVFSTQRSLESILIVACGSEDEASFFCPYECTHFLELGVDKEEGRQV